MSAAHRRANAPRIQRCCWADCSDVVSVYDYQNPSDIKLIKTFSAADLGYDGSTPLKTCDETGKAGVMLSPHGTGTSAATGRVYHFLTGTGQIAIFDIDADVPTVKLVQTAGSGGASVRTCPAVASWWCRSAAREKCIKEPTDRFVRSVSWPLL